MDNVAGVCTHAACNELRFMCGQELATPVVIFEGTRNAEFYGSILRTSLLPFIRSTYPDSHCFIEEVEEAC